MQTVTSLMVMCLGLFLAWDASEDPRLSHYLLYLRPMTGQYDLSSPIDPHGTRETRLDCRTLSLTREGPWGVVVVAIGRDGEHSEPTPEIIFWWDKEEGCQRHPRLII